jgi:hypothetical protein
MNAMTLLRPWGVCWGIGVEVGEGEDIEDMLVTASVNEVMMSDMEPSRGREQRSNPNNEAYEVVTSLVSACMGNGKKEKVHVGRSSSWSMATTAVASLEIQTLRVPDGRHMGGDREVLVEASLPRPYNVW